MCRGHVCNYDNQHDRIYMDPGGKLTFLYQTHPIEIVDSCQKPPSHSMWLEQSNELQTNEQRNKMTGNILNKNSATNVKFKLSFSSYFSLSPIRDRKLYGKKNDNIIETVPFDMIRCRK